MKKITAILLALVLVLSLLAGCANVKKPEANSGTEKEVPVQKTASAEPFLSVGGREITEEQYLGFVKNAKNMYESSLGEITDFTAEAPDGTGRPIYDLLKDMALENVLMYYSLDDIAAEKGIEITEEEKAEIESVWEQLSVKYGGEEALLEEIKEVYGSKENYEYFATHSYLYSECFAALYGDDGSLLSDEEVLEYTKDDGYIQVKHILLSTLDSEKKPLSDIEKGKVLEKAKSLAAELRAYDGDDISGNFDKYVEEYSTDPGGKNGYLFVDGDMVPEFTAGALALDFYEISDPVESTYGYHIILRLPVDPSYTPAQYRSMGYTMSLRGLVADDMYYNSIVANEANLEVVTSEKYDSLNVATLFVG